MISHLEELRSRLIKSLIFILGGTALGFWKSDLLMGWVRAPIQPFLASSPWGKWGVTGLVYTSPLDQFMAHVKISFWAGLLGTSPFWLYQIWKFLEPGLLRHEKKWALSFVGLGSFLFGLGVSFTYWVIIPVALRFLMNFGEVDQPLITLDRYLSFFTTMTLMLGLAFEVPLVLVLLSLTGWINASFLRSHRRYAIVGLTVLSAIITPPDLVSMLLLLIPLVILYEISIGLIEFFKRKSDSLE